MNVTTQWNDIKSNDPCEIGIYENSSGMFDQTRKGTLVACMNVTRFLYKQQPDGNEKQGAFCDCFGKEMTRYVVMVQHMYAFLHAIARYHHNQGILSNILSEDRYTVRSKIKVHQYHQLIKLWH